MEDSRQIENLIYTYADRIDAGDLEAVAELFRHAEIVAPVQETANVGYEQVLAMYQNSTRLYPATGTPLTKHVTTNLIIEVDQQTNAQTGKASSKAYYTVIQATDALALQPIIAGRYRDQFEKVDGQWRFSRREMYVDLMGDLSQHLLFDSTDLN